MNPKTTLLLLLVAGVLGFLVWRQTEREDPEQGVLVAPLLEGYDPSRVVALRWDNLERSMHVALERDSAGRWYMVDPVAYPARREMLDQILKALANTATRVAPAELAATDPGLNPPRAVVEVREALASGEELHRKVEVGAVDLDGMRVYARVDGQVVRTGRNLETPLLQHWQDWRTRYVFELEAPRIVQIRREGFLFAEDHQQPLELQAQLRGNGWWIDRPERFQADPLAMGGWGMALATLTVDKFRSDDEQGDLKRFGLDAPWFRVTLTDRAGNEQTLEVAVVLGQAFAKRADMPYVWELDGRELTRLTADVRDLYDRHFGRLAREEVETIRLFGEQGHLRFTQSFGEGSWTVAHEDPGGEWTLERPVNREVLDRVLRTFEQTEIVGYLWDDTVKTWFPEGDPVRGLWMESGGVRYGGRTGLVRTTEQGTKQLTFLREGESAVSLLPVEVTELLTLSPLEAESMNLVDVMEVRLRALRLTREDGTPREFRREVQGTWVYGDSPNQQAREILPVLDRLLFLKAARHYAPSERQDLHDIVRIELFHAEGTALLELGLTADGEARAQIGARQSKLLDQDLYGVLAELAKN